VINKIYLDLDGVVTDFVKRYTEIFDDDPVEARKNKRGSQNWTDFVHGKHFELLDYHEGALELLQYLEETGIEVEILSSSGGEKYHEIVEQQKINWLNARNISHKVNIVSGRRKKALFANENSILIDDTPDNIVRFIDAGGHGIYHTNVNETIEKLNSLLNSD
jgi:hypothetical protein